MAFVFDNYTAYQDSSKLCYNTSSIGLFEMYINVVDKIIPKENLCTPDIMWLNVE